MTADKPSPLVPKLRFPEFTERGPWVGKPLADLCDRVSETVGDTQLTPVSISAGKGFVPQAEKFGRDISGSQYGKYIWLRRGDFAYNRGNSKRFPQGCVYQLTEFDEAAASNAFHCFRLHDHCEPAFLLGFFEYNGHGRQLIRHITSGARSNGLLNISADTFFGISVPVPPTSTEQQKVADCLGSLDDLIAAEGRKLEALRQHKQGLMQQLFPQPGKGVPRLRFPEFQKAPKWECKELSRCLKKVIDYRGKAPPKSDSGAPLITAKNVRAGWLDFSNDEYIEKDKYDSWMSKGTPEAGDILFTTEAPLGNAALFPSEGAFALGQRIITIRTDHQEYLPGFLLHSLLSPRMQKEIEFRSTGSTAKGIKASAFLRVSLCAPRKEEQQRIEVCLTSIDERIAAQSQKLDALVAHKQGLLQQLFPSLDGQ